MESYRWVLDYSAAREFEALPAQERRRLFAVFDALARHPFQEGHLRYRDQAGFEFRVCFLGSLDLHYRLDHAVREVRIVVVERHPSLGE
jgi:hypothetical protein